MFFYAVKMLQRCRVYCILTDWGRVEVAIRLSEIAKIEELRLIFEFDTVFCET